MKSKIEISNQDVVGYQMITYKVAVFINNTLAEVHEVVIININTGDILFSKMGTDLLKLQNDAFQWILKDYNDN
jgi:hypothetical protein